MIRLSNLVADNITDRLRGLFHYLECCTGCGCIAQTGTPLKNGTFSTTKAGRVLALILFSMARNCLDTTDISLLCTKTSFKGVSYDDRAI